MAKTYKVEISTVDGGKRTVRNVPEDQVWVEEDLPFMDQTVVSTHVTEEE